MRSPKAKLDTFIGTGSVYLEIEEEINKTFSVRVIKDGKLANEDFLINLLEVIGEAYRKVGLESSFDKAFYQYDEERMQAIKDVRFLMTEAEITPPNNEILRKLKEISDRSYYGIFDKDIECQKRN